MKFRILFFLILLSSCKEDDKAISSYITVYDSETYMELYLRNKNANIVVIDTVCFNQRRKALSDLDKGKLYYFHSKTWPEWKEMEELLVKYNIEFKNHEVTCLRNFPPEFDESCYEEVMWTEINKRIGESVIDSLWLIAERNFVLKYPDSLYMKDGIDVREKYLSK
jgi:hypothetical protein